MERRCEPSCPSRSRPSRKSISGRVSVVPALNHGVERMGGGFPLSNRLLREMHARLLASGRGAAMLPGEFRRSQNRIGGSRPGNAAFVPPPPNRVQDCMAGLERFIHATDDGLPVLIKAGLAHVQFETIHPFLDGTGRQRGKVFTYERYLAVLREGTEEPPG